MRVVFFLAGAALGFLVGVSGEIGLAALIESVFRVKLPNPALLAIPLPIVLAVLSGRAWARDEPSSPAVATLFSTIMLCITLLLDFAWLASPGAGPSGWAETLFFYGVSLGPLAGLVSALWPARRRAAT